jgi:hypothetical protein
MAEDEKGVAVVVAALFLDTLRRSAAAWSMTFR